MTPSTTVLTDYLKRVCRFFALLASVPVFVGFSGAWSAGFGFFIFLLAIPAAAIIVVVGAFAWLVRGPGSMMERAIAVSVAPVLLVMTVVVTLPLLGAGNFAGTFVRLMLNYNHYEAIVAKAKKSRDAAWYANDRGVIYSTDAGPPVRVAFNPDGSFLDNWSGIIYDPTGDVMLANGFDPNTGKFFAPDRVTKLFAGDLVSCRKLWGNYYSCSFT